MKFFTRNFCVKTLGVFSVVLVFSLTMHAEVDPPQRDMRISPAAAGTFAADWQGEENRIYFPYSPFHLLSQIHLHNT